MPGARSENIVSPPSRDHLLIQIIQRDSDTRGHYTIDTVITGGLQTNCLGDDHEEVLKVLIVRIMVFMSDKMLEKGF